MNVHYILIWFASRLTYPNLILHTENQITWGIFVVVCMMIVSLSVSTIMLGKFFPVSQFEALKSLQDEVDEVLSRNDILNPAVSAWSTHQHIEHVFKVNLLVLEKIKNNDPDHNRMPRTFTGMLVLVLGFIPRGRGEAPSSVLPEGISQADIMDAGSRIRELLIQIKDTETENRFIMNHPYFGGLTSREWLRFLVIHTRHHLEIIREMREKPVPV
jgi:hypothetical protein